MHPKKKVEAKTWSSRWFAEKADKRWLVEKADKTRNFKFRGIVLRVNPPIGTFILQDRESLVQFGASFDCIDGYMGETSREIGLHEGTQVLFNVTGHQIESVQLIPG